jgi:RHS repeat-associated protein
MPRIATTTISDKKFPINNNGLIDYYVADITSVSDYYPFGSPMDGRTFSSEKYRFGFQGQEAENEISGIGNYSFFKYRISDNRLGRFFAIDPLSDDYPELSTYQFSSLNPIWMREIEGLEGEKTTTENVGKAPSLPSAIPDQTNVVINPQFIKPLTVVPQSPVKNFQSVTPSLPKTPKDNTSKQGNINTPKSTNKETKRVSLDFTQMSKVQVGFGAGDAMAGAQLAREVKGLPKSGALTIADALIGGFEVLDNYQNGNVDQAKFGMLEMGASLLLDYYVPVIKVVYVLSQTEYGLTGTCGVLQKEINFNMYQWKATKDDMYRNRAIIAEKALITQKQTLLSK